jgi:hypothetical protein
MKRKQFDKLSAIDGTDYGFDPEEGKFAARGICSWGAAATAAVGVYSSSKSNKQAKKATNQQLQGTANAAQDLRNASTQAQQTIQPVVDLYGRQLPVLQADAARYGQIGQQGQTALTAQQGALNVNQFLDPSMKFAMQQGTQAIQGSAAARGGVLSGAAMKDLTAYSQGLASQNYDAAVTRALQNRQQQIGIGNTMSQLGQNKLSTDEMLFKTGLSGINQLSGIQQGLGQDIASLSQSAGNVAARGTAAQQDPLSAGFGAFQSSYNRGFETPSTPPINPTGGANNGFNNAINSGVSQVSDYIGNIFSDENVKHNVKKASDADIAEFLSNMEPSTYKYDDSVIAEGAPTGEQTGVMAQDVEKSKMGKNMVETNDKNVKVIDVNKSVAGLMAATASLNKRINKLEGK